MTFSIADRRIGPDAPCFIIGEVGNAHDGSLGLAHCFVDAIAQAGADAVKFQTHIAEAESSTDEPFRVQFSPQDASRFDYWKRLEFTADQWRGLADHARKRGLVFLSSPFSFEAADLLIDCGVPAWKIASGELSNLPLIERLAASGLPLLFSTGMSDMNEVDGSVAIARDRGIPFAVLQCTTSYPCPPELVGLGMLDTFRERYHCPVGLSDHSGTVFPSLAAATVGCDVLEVHVTLSREMFGPDVAASVTAAELAEIVRGVRFIERMRASQPSKDGLAREFAPLRAIFTKSVAVARDLSPGHVLTVADLAFRKPGSGIPAASRDTVVGKRLARPVRRGAILQWEDIAQ